MLVHETFENLIKYHKQGVVLIGCPWEQRAYWAEEPKSAKDFEIMDALDFFWIARNFTDNPDEPLLTEERLARAPEGYTLTVEIPETELTIPVG